MSRTKRYRLEEEVGMSIDEARVRQIVAEVLQSLGGTEESRGAIGSESASWSLPAATMCFTALWSPLKM